MFVAALLSELLVIGLWLGTDIGFLWFNVIGCGAVLALVVAAEQVRIDRRFNPDHGDSLMKTRSRFLCVVLATFGVTTLVTRADAKKPAPAAPAANAAPTRAFQSDFLGLLDDVQKKILSLEDAVPADKFTWRPAPGVRSIAEAYLHIAFGNYTFTKTATGKEPPADAGWEMNRPQVGRQDDRQGRDQEGAGEVLRPRPDRDEGRARTPTSTRR